MRHAYIPQKRHQQQGFTIMELLIATLVFSVILLIISSGVIHFTDTFYKGVNSSTTQNTTRGIMDTVSQAIQFGYSAPTSGTTAAGAAYRCIGNQEFVYYLGQEVDSSHHGLIQLTGTTCTNNPNLAKGKELLQQDMHLAEFSIQPDATGSLWTIGVRVAFADNDAGGTTNSLLCAPTAATDVPNSCSPSGYLNVDTDLRNAAVLSDLHCKSDTGSQFCYVAALTTAVQRRVNVST